MVTAGNFNTRGNSPKFGQESALENSIHIIGFSGSSEDSKKSSSSHHSAFSLLSLDSI